MTCFYYPVFETTIFQRFNGLRLLIWIFIWLVPCSAGYLVSEGKIVSWVCDQILLHFGKVVERLIVYVVHAEGGQIVPRMPWNYTLWTLLKIFLKNKWLIFFLKLPTVEESSTLFYLYSTFVYFHTFFGLCAQIRLFINRRLALFTPSEFLVFAYFRLLAWFGLILRFFLFFLIAFSKINLFHLNWWTIFIFIIFKLYDLVFCAHIDYERIQVVQVVCCFEVEFVC